jgi:hypothetical protein
MKTSDTCPPGDTSWFLKFINFEPSEHSELQPTFVTLGSLNLRKLITKDVRGFVIESANLVGQIKG